MSLKFSKVGETLRGFALASKMGVYGVVETKVDPKIICDFVDYRSFSYSIRYLYNIPLIIFYPDFVTQSTQRSVEGSHGQDVILGDVVIFGMEDGGIRSLTDFEIAMMKDNISLEKTNQVNHLMLSGVTKESRSLPAKEGADD